MIKHFKLYAILAGMCVLAPLSCTDELDLAPVSSIGVAGFWKTPGDADGGVMAMYHHMRVMGQVDRTLYFLGEARSETMGDEQERNPSHKIAYMTNNVTTANADVSWLQIYKVISSANLVLKYVPGISFPSVGNKNRYLAEAYAMRAFMYFVLARSWEDVPIVTEPTEGYDPETTFKAREPVADVFALIKQDIEEAIKLFPDNSFPQGRATWSLPAVNALKGDVYLWTAKRMGGGNADLQTALAALQAVQSADVQLLDDYASVFDYNNKGNKEIIFAMHFNVDEIGNNHYSRMYPLDGEIIRSNEAKARLLPGGEHWWSPSTYVRNQFNMDDTRRAASFADIYTYSEDGNDSTWLTSGVTKFKGTVVTGVRRFSDDIPIYRYADVLLLIAEAKNALGQDPSTEINLVRQRAYGAKFSPDHVFTSTTQEANDAAILQERLFELAFEGKRFWDLVRFGKAYELAPSLQGRENVPLLWPVPEAVLTRNSRLTQTPGY
jgi:hypothetical protein